MEVILTINRLVAQPESSLKIITLMYYDKPNIGKKRGIGETSRYPEDGSSLDHMVAGDMIR
jgi:hypothetical protein